MDPVLPFLLAHSLVSVRALVLAYVDPGTGSMLLQALIGGLLGLLFALKMYWRKLKASVARFAGRGRAGGGDG